MEKKEVVEVLETLLDGLTAGESTEKKLEDTKKFYESELAKVNTEKQFYERVIRFYLLEMFTFLMENGLERFEPPSGSKLFLRQSQNNEHMLETGFSLEDFNNFVEEYLTTAKNDKLIGIKEETK